MKLKLRRKKYSDESGGLTAGIANIHPATGNLSANKNRMVTALEVFAGEGVNMAVFPEYGLSGAFWDDEARCSAHMAKSSLDRLIPWLENRIKPYINNTLEYIVINGPVPDGRGRYYNTTVVIDRSGIGLAGDRTYKKTFLPGSEKDHIVSGLDDSLVMETPYGRLGFLTCYDICFPQLLTDLVYNHEIDILVVTAAWRCQGERSYPGTSIREINFYRRQWEMLVPALASQHQIWIIAANAVGPHALPNTDYCGKSGVWVPSGINMILGSDQDEELLVLKNMAVKNAVHAERASFGCVDDYNRLQAVLKKRNQSFADTCK